MISGACGSIRLVKLVWTNLARAQMNSPETKIFDVGQKVSNMSEIPYLPGILYKKYPSFLCSQSWRPKLENGGALFALFGYTICTI